MDENKEPKIEISPYEEPWEVAQKIINAKFEVESLFDNSVKMKRSFFAMDELLRLGMHIVNYCNTEMERSKNA